MTRITLKIVKGNSSLGLLTQNIINKFQYMKGQKKIKHHRQLSQGLPVIQNNGRTQTIIINNPNFNINYIQHPAYNVVANRENNNKTIQEIPYYDPKNSSKGIDAWNLNKNLKEFSETRQLKFYKGNIGKTRSNSQLHNSPYIIHKTKTIGIKPYSKVSPANVNSFQQNKTMAIRKNEPVKPVRQNSNLSLSKPSMGTLDSNNESKISFRKRIFQSKPKNSKPDNSGGIFQSYLNKTIKMNETTVNNGSKTERVQKKGNPSRKNKFIEIDQSQRSLIKNKSQNEEDMEDIENQLVMNELSPQKNTKSSNEQLEKEVRRHNRKFEKSRQKISKYIQSKVNNYFDKLHNKQISTAQIQLYTTTARQPFSTAQSVDYKSSQNNQLDIFPNSYDFKFEGETPYRPKTPYKRKKMYQEA